MKIALAMAAIARSAGDFAGPFYYARSDADIYFDQYFRTGGSKRIN